MKIMSADKKQIAVRIDLQNDDGLQGIPDIGQFELWVSRSLQQHYAQLEQSIRIVDEAESRQLNQQYRGKDRPTNVLSFAADDSAYLEYVHLGDLVICAPVVEREASEQGKDVLAHWSHMVVHGMLHLQGYDHDRDDEAGAMEALETEILTRLGFPAPYDEQAS